jgi:hypothetical protein
VRILVARLSEDPISDACESFAVAYIYFEEHRITIEPVQSAFEGTPTVESLRQIVSEIGGGDPYWKLQSLRFGCWSFEVPQVH